MSTQREIDPEPITKIGQHLLNDAEILQGMADLVPASSTCIEIGPGFGSLTERLIANGNQVIAYEVDERTESALGAIAAGGNLEVHWANFLDIPNHELNRYSPFHLVGNIPFHISEPLITKMVDLQFESAVLLVGERLAKAIQTTDPGHSDWSRVSMVAQAFFDTEEVLSVPREAFTPPPRVDGKIIRQVRKEDGVTDWRSDPLILSYRAITEANAENSTLAKALKGIMVTPEGRAQSASEAGDKKRNNRAQRRVGRSALRDYASEYNFGSVEQKNTGRNAEPQTVLPQHMLTILQSIIDSRVLSKPLSGVNNSELRKVCAAISAAVNRRTKAS